MCRSYHFAVASAVLGRSGGVWLFPRIRGLWGKVLGGPCMRFFFFFKVEISSRAQIPLIKAKDQSTVAQ